MENVGQTTFHGNMNDKPSGLNGLRVPLFLNLGTLVILAAPLIIMYADIQQLKSERQERVSVERIARIEAMLQANTDLRYRSTDAERDFALRDERIRELHDKIRVLESK